MTEQEGFSGRPHADIAREASFSNALDDAQQMCSTLVNDIDGYWLSETMRRLRRPRGFKGKSKQVVIDTERTFSFRSPLPMHNLLSVDETAHYHTMVAEEGARVFKIRGSGYSDWIFYVDNGQVGLDLQYVHLMYNKIKQPYVVRMYSGRYDLKTGYREER